MAQYVAAHQVPHPTSMAGATGLEPATSGVTGRRSNQLSYAPAASTEAGTPTLPSEGCQGVRVRSSGTPVYVLFSRPLGETKPTRITIGRLDGVSPADARQRG
jgi:hypothetical protein